MILHPRTAQHIEQFVGAPRHALLLVGAHGMGKSHLSRHILARVLELPLEKLDTHRYYKIITPDKGTISIDAVRELQRFLQLKTVGQGNTSGFRRAVLLEHAEALTTEAQNAYLKLLEEPPSDTIMLLTANSPRGLLPTIRSRLQTISVYAPESNEVQAFFAQAGGHDQTRLTQAFFLSGGLPGLMHALLADDKGHPLFDAVATAKEILQKPTFERLALVDSLAKQKEDAKFVLQALAHIAQTGLTAATAKNDAAKVTQWHRILTQTQTASNALAQNANTKLALTNMMLQL